MSASNSSSGRGLMMVRCAHDPWRMCVLTSGPRVASFLRQFMIAVTRLSRSSSRDRLRLRFGQGTRWSRSSRSRFRLPDFDVAAGRLRRRAGLSRCTPPRMSSPVASWLSHRGCAVVREQLAAQAARHGGGLGRCYGPSPPPDRGRHIAVREQLAAGGCVVPARFLNLVAETWLWLDAGLMRNIVTAWRT